MIAEETELLAVRLTGTSGVSGGSITVDNTPAIITILDNEESRYEILGDDVVAEEDGIYVMRLRRTGKISSNARIRLLRQTW